MIYIKTEEEITRIQSAANLWKQMVQACSDLIKINNTPLMLANKAEAVACAAGGTCAFKNYQGFPGSICVSVNEVCIHGIPDNRPFQPTDKVAVDIGVSLNGVVCDSGFTKLVDPAANPSYQALVQHNYQALWAGIKAAVNGNYTGDIAYAIESYVQTNCPQYSILNDFVGHGCGLHLHESPHVPNKGMKPKQGTKLVPGMVICIEPILTTAKNGIYTIDKDDKWSVKVNVGGQSCHWEHMVLIKEDESIVLTAMNHELEQQIIKRKIDEH